MAKTGINGFTEREKEEFFGFLRRITLNQEFSRAAFARYLAGNGQMIDEACGYPVRLTFQDYKNLIDREGVAARANSIFPSECWSVQPYVYETEAMSGEAQTEFEVEWLRLTERLKIFHKLARLDEVSGIGHYGVLLLGLNDGRPLDQPYPGVDEKGNVKGTNRRPELLYLMPFSEGEAKIDEWVNDERSERYGKPLFYKLTLARPETGSGELTVGTTKRVHWSRCLHVADGLTTSDVIGTPRLQKIYNYILNFRKILGGSAEMFYQGGFPGTAFEVPPELAMAGELDKEELQKEIESYLSGFKRYLALKGVVAKQLMPNIANPEQHIKVQLMAIACSIEVPLRIFMGSEEARLASMQDSESWNRRVHRRHNVHVTPNILRPFVDLLIEVGVLPKPKTPYKVRWPDIYAISKKDLADITGKLVRALAEYVRAGVSRIFPPLEFFTMIMDLTIEEAEQVISAAEEAVRKGTYEFMEPEDLQPPKPGKSLFPPERKPPLGETRKVKIGEVDVNVGPLKRCHQGGLPGYTWEEGGKCFTYRPQDQEGRKRARKKAELHRAATEIARRLVALEEEEQEGGGGTSDH